MAEPLSGGRLGLRVRTRQGAATGHSQPGLGRDGAGKGAQVCECDEEGREGGAWAPQPSVGGDRGRGQGAGVGGPPLAPLPSRPSRGAGTLAGDAVSSVAWGHPAHSSQAESVFLQPR